MKIRTIAQITCGIAIATATQIHAKSIKGSRPNIILVMTDDQGMGDLSCMGNEIVKTPNLDKFYQQSTRFTDFQVNPTCAPTRAAVMSGRSALKNGVTHTIMQRERMALDVFTLPQILVSAGYETALFGKWHLGDEEAYLPGSRGFNEVLMHGAGGIGQVGLGDFPTNDENSYFDNVLLHNETIVKTKGFCTDLFFSAGLAWIKEQHTAKKPYFAFISLNAPHGPFFAPESYKKRFLNAGYDEKTAGRYGMVENIDDNFATMMSKLEEWKALENTLVIFMTDNGMSMPRMEKDGEFIAPFNAGMKGRKNSAHEGATHVPAFWYWKGVLAEGADINALAADLDLLPTFTEISGATLPEKMQELEGRSLVPLLEDANTDWPNREIFLHCGRWATGKAEEFKYVKSTVRTNRWRLVDHTKLYDIANDPGETKDVSKEYPELVDQLQKSYDQWWESAIPMMVNENLPKIKDHPFHLRYEKQLEEQGIPEWAPAAL